MTTDVDENELESIRQKRLEVRINAPGLRIEGGVQHVTDAKFPRVLGSNDIIVLDFSADWCGPCKMMGPIMEELARKYGDKVYVGKLDVDGNPITAGMFGVYSIPTILFFKNGKAVSKVVGAVPMKKLESVLQGIL